MLLEAVVAAFVATQLCYFVVNCGLLGLFLRRPTNVVDERTLGRVLEATATRERGADRPNRNEHPTRTRADGGRRAATRGDGPGSRCRLPESRRRRLRVFVPVDRDGWGPLRRTLESLAAGSYPAGSITVYLVFESPDTRPAELEGAVGARHPSGLEVEPIEIDGAGDDGEGTPVGNVDLEWAFAGPELPRTAAAAVAAAYAQRAAAIAPDDVVTVLEPGTWVPVDAIELAVAGLAEYDVVRAKRTVVDVDRGVLPLLESTAAAARSDLGVGSRSGPYRLPATASFLEAGTLAALDRWRRETDAPLPLGAAASRRGYALGVVDRYVQVPCPVGFAAWLREKRGWIGGLRRDLFVRGRARVDDLRRWSGTLLLLSFSVVSVVGLPAAALVALLAAGGADAAALSTPTTVLLGFNGLVWAYCVVRASRTARRAVPFRSPGHALAYSLVANPLSQALYATLWAAPIALGVVDAVRGD